MEQVSRIRFTLKQRAELWERWKGGQCVADIARALERRNKSGVYRVLALNGGIAPATRRRAAAALRIEEREEISRGIAAGHSIRRIAERLGRAAERPAENVPPIDYEQCCSDRLNPPSLADIVFVRCRPNRTFLKNELLLNGRVYAG